MFNTLPLNPAYAGSQESLNMTAVYRKQWTSVDGAPNTQTFSAHSPLKIEKMALGFSAFHDKIGVTSKTGFYGVYAYRINLKNKSKLSFGLQAGLLNQVAHLSRLQTKLPDDPAVSSDRQMYLCPAFGSGVYWYSRKFYLGASIPDLMEIYPRNITDQVIRYRHLFVQGGVVYTLSPNVKYMPGFLVKAVQGNAFQYDLNNIFIINDVLWLGISYRNAVSVNFITQVQLTNQLSFGYAYDLPAGKYGKQFSNSHELNLSYKFIFMKDNAFMPRYF
jgi:type IX secretion system PorP/SprF family membrane protein